MTDDIDTDIPEMPTTEELAAYLAALPPVGLPFVLQRTHDVSGVSGTGIVCDGMMFPDLRVATRWRAGAAGVAQTCVWDSIHHVQKIHGHDGATTVKSVPVDALVEALKDVLTIPPADQLDFGNERAAAAWDGALYRVYEAIAGALWQDMALDADVEAMHAARTADRNRT